MLLITLLLANPPVLTRGDDLAPKVDALFWRWDKQGSPGAAVAVIPGGEVLLARGYAMADLEHDVPVTPRTPFYIASVAKQFTAFAVARLAREGRLALDDDIRRHLPEMQDLGATVTIRHLIHHTSGVRDYGGLLALAGGRDGDLIRREDVLGLLRRQRGLNFRPGEEHQYSNSNYVLLAAIIERAAKRSYRDWMAQEVFGPLGMARSEVGDDLGRLIKGRAWSYEPRPGEGAGFRAVNAPITAYGDGNIYCSAEDLARWLANLGAPRLGGEAVTKQMVEPGLLNGGARTRYAYGLVVGEYRGLRLIGHGGAWAGYRAYAGRFPDQDLGVVVLSNHASIDPEGMAMRVAEICLSGAMKEPEERGPGERAGPPMPAQGATRRIAPPAPSAKEAAAYTGRYACPELAMGYEVVAEGGALAVRIPRREDIPLEPVREDEFVGFPYPQLPMEVRFQRGSAGRVAGFQVTTFGVRDLWFDREH
jgi:CubicO group peptidase (beta-lactamase class C family)